MKARPGFSLIELVLACALFSLLGLVLFGMVEFGFRAFSMGGERMNTDGEMEVVLAQIRKDIELSNFVSLQLNDTPTVAVPLDATVSNQPRHRLCMAGMNDWGDANNYDPGSGMPLWNRYWLYHADLQKTGHLFRIEISHTRRGNRGADPWTAFYGYQSAFPDAPPPVSALVGGDRIERVHPLTSRLFGWECRKTAAALVVDIRLQGSGRSSPTGGRRTEVLEAQARIVPRNRFQ